MTLYFLGYKENIVKKKKQNCQRFYLISLMVLNDEESCFCLTVAITKYYH